MSARHKSSMGTALLILEAIEYAEELGSTFSCDSANDLKEIARWLHHGIVARHVALLRFYASDEQGEATACELDRAIAKALLAFADGDHEDKTLDAIRDAIASFERTHERCACLASNSLTYCGKCSCGWVKRAEGER